MLKKAADRLLASPTEAYHTFCTRQDFWLEDYALFMAIKAEQASGRPRRLAGRAAHPSAGSTGRRPGRGWRSRWIIYKAVQFFFYTQWNALKAYANCKRRASWWATFPSMSARIPATCGPTRSCSRPMGRST